ncbi:alpha/beta fold hydrolase [Caulobacter sp. BP25]|uniref:alpha/beta fold hydrolase n=1 Tax=Caulobacter sp. BP25 TaxID=2048900 RepID=UPI000C129DE3|nr:alpha/beta hydrolase [Caulobacter sp. BP25]PHY17504.1 alpha/beta hydrolase [Caulobacter sp. BP25]
MQKLMPKAHLFAVIMAILAALGVFGSRADAADRMTVTVTGKGPDVVLIPGLASSAAVWDQTAKQLSASHRVHVVQVAGFAGAPVGGAAEGPVVEPLVAAVDAYIKANNLKSPAIIGHSMGGFTGLLLAQRHPEDVGRLMIVDSLPFFPLLFSPTATPERVTPQAAAMREATIAMSAEAFASQQALTAPRFVKSVKDQVLVLDWSKTSSQSVVGRAMYDLLTTDARPGLAGIKSLVTLLYPYDPAMGAPPSMVEKIYTDAYATLPGVTVKRVDDSRHFIMLDQPKVFAEAVADFLK